MNEDRVYPSPAVRASMSDDGLVLLDVEGGLILGANQVGALIWQRIGQGRAPSEIAQQLAVQFDVPLERVYRDVAAFVSALKKGGLVIEEPMC